MLMIVYGFPSKLTALQFEWAWQKPELSRHLRHLGYKKDNKRNWVERKILIAFTLLNVPPFSRYSLQVRCFDQRAYNLYCSHGGIAILDLKGVSSLDIADERLEEVVEAWVDREDVCDLCDKPTEDGIMCTECHCMSHVSCLAAYFLRDSERLLPTTGECPRCGVQLDWAQVIRGRFAIRACHASQ